MKVLGKGLVRHIVVKIGFATQEIMVILVINGDKLPVEQDFANDLVKKCDLIKTIVVNSNMKNTNVILGDKNKVIYGNGYIEDYLGDFKFKISPNSFYQVNPVQAEALYNIAIESAKIDKDDIVFDLYCGIGTISLFAAKFAKNVYGVEIVPQAIEDAKENARINDVHNVEFLQGDTEFVLDNLLNTQKIVPNVVIVDPPRKGLDKVSINNLLNINPEKIVYISCNPASLVRDLSLLEDVYDINMIQPVDMFCFSSHVEVCALLELKKCQ